MKLKCLLSIPILLLLTSFVSAQKVIQLPMPVPSGSIKWTGDEREFSPFPNSPDKIVANVSQPTLTAYLPKNPNGTAIIVCPGGAFHILSMTNEGTDVAKWLNEKGIAVFVLKYRLVPSSDESLQKAFALLGANDQKKVNELIAPVLPLALSDGLTAIGYVREHAKEFGVNPKRIGIMGFSAGGTVSAGAAFNYTAETRPDFVALIYAFLTPFAESKVPADAPPMFIAVTSDDNFNFAPSNAELYTKWNTVGKTAELHIYTKGGHGFGMKKQNLPSDTWIDSFYAFLKQEVIK